MLNFAKTNSSRPPIINSFFLLFGLPFAHYDFEEKQKIVRPLVVQEEENDAVRILSLQTNNELDQLACAVGQPTKNVLAELDSCDRNSFANKAGPNNRPAASANHRENDKENLENFCAQSLVINKARIEVQTVEAVQMDLDSVQLFTTSTCDLDLGDECFCITHDIYELEKGDQNV